MIVKFLGWKQQILELPPPSKSCVRVCVCVWFYFDMHFERYDMTLLQIVAGLQLLWQITGLSSFCPHCTWGQVLWVFGGIRNRVPNLCRLPGYLSTCTNKKHTWWNNGNLESQLNKCKLIPYINNLDFPRQLLRNVSWPVCLKHTYLVFCENALAPRINLLLFLNFNISHGGSYESSSFTHTHISHT